MKTNKGDIRQLIFNTKGRVFAAARNGVVVVGIRLGVKVMGFGLAFNPELWFRILNLGTE